MSYKMLRLTKSLRKIICIFSKDFQQYQSEIYKLNLFTDVYGIWTRFEYWIFEIILFSYFSNEAECTLEELEVDRCAVVTEDSSDMMQITDIAKVKLNNYIH